MAIASQTFRWTEKYAVNVEALDNQHRRLFATTNELHDALSYGEGAAAVDAVLPKLVDYALSHFAAEEALMKKHGFPEVANHRAEHEEFVRNVTEFIEKYRAGKAGVPVELLLFLQSWLKQHILITDKAYSSFLNERGVR